MTQALQTPSGFPLLIESDPALPLVDVSILWRAGSIRDPEGREGLTRLLARLMQRGARRQSATDVDQTLARLGARLSFRVSREVIRIHGSVLSRNLEPFLHLLAKLMMEPALRASDLAREKRRVKAALADMRDDDGALAGRFFRRQLFGEHAYARSMSGSAASLGRIRRADLQELHAQTMRRPTLLFGLAGDVKTEDAGQLIDDAFGAARGRKPATIRIRRPKATPGRTLVVVDKKDRQQTQLGIGTLGASIDHPQRTALVVADSAFGGLFTSRLMQEVRAKRGFSYSVHSQLELPTQRGAWSMWSHPSADNARACAELQLALLEQWVHKGLTRDEVQFTKRYLVGSRCLEVDTASSRVDLALESVYRGYPVDFPAGFTRRVRAVKAKDANAVVRECLDPSSLTIVAVGDAQTLVPELSALPGVDEVRVVPFDAP